MADMPAETHGEAEDAGGARRAAEHAPRDDRDRWSGFSIDDASDLAADPAAPEGAEKPLAGLPRTLPIKPD